MYEREKTGLEAGEYAISGSGSDGELRGQERI